MSLASDASTAHAPPFRSNLMRTCTCLARAISARVPVLVHAALRADVSRVEQRVEESASLNVLELSKYDSKVERNEIETNPTRVATRTAKLRVLTISQVEATKEQDFTSSKSGTIRARNAQQSRHTKKLSLNAKERRNLSE